MYLVAIHHWPQETAKVAEIVAAALNILVFEARQKIIGGEPIALASFSDQNKADELAKKITSAGIPAWVVDTHKVRNSNLPKHASRFELGTQILQVEISTGESLEIGYETIDLLLIATCSGGQIETTKTTVQRKFSLGKTLLSGGIPLTKKVKTTETLTSEEREKTFWLYTRTGETLIFTCNAVDYAGLGKARQLTRELNFTHLLKELQRMAPQARYNDQLLTRGGQAQILGQVLNPARDLDLAFAILSQSLRVEPADLSRMENQ